jgi:hypothetical protein
LTTRPIIASPTGTLRILPVRLTSLPSRKLRVVAQQHRAHLILFQAHRQAGNAMRKRQQLARHDLIQAMNAGNAVAQRNDRANLIDPNLRVVIRDLLAEDLRNLVCLYLSHCSKIAACSSAKI